MFFCGYFMKREGSFMVQLHVRVSPPVEQSQIHAYAVVFIHSMINIAK